MNSSETYESSVCAENLSLCLFTSPHDAVVPGRTAHFSPHTHAYIELFACVRGRLVIRVGDENVCLTSGDLCFVPSGLPHGRVESEGEWFAIAVSIRRRSVRNVQDLFSPLSHFFSSPRIFREREDICANLGSTTDSPKTAIPCLAALNVLCTCAGLCNCAPCKSDRRNEPASVSTDFDLSLISRLETRIETGYSGDLRPEDLAAELYISPRQLSRIVKKRYGMSLHVLILKKRIDAAKNLLSSTDAPASEIAAKVGFASKESFYRAFRESMGVTPAAYRAKAKEKGKEENK